jgi:hypothetical protein
LLAKWRRRARGGRAVSEEIAMRRLALFATVTAIACGAFASPIGAQQMVPSGPRMPCHNSTEIAKQLNSKYDEAPVAFGLQSNGHLLQVWSSEDKGTWTVVSTSPAGVSCIVAAGKRWESLPYIKNDPMA